MKNQPFDYYMHDGPTAFRFELSGNLNDEGARRLDQDWRTASSIIGVRKLIVDMTFVTGAGEKGRALLARWHREGARLVAISKSSRELAESIVGEPLPEPPVGAAASERTWLPFRALFRRSVVSALALAALVFPVQAHAATLRSETVAAWNDYLQKANVHLQDRVRPGGAFLWTFENVNRAARVRGGEIVAAPAPGPNPRKVPGGLIHHWIGAVFVPNTKLDDMVVVARAYDHYKEFYPPSVIDSKLIARNGADDKFSMQLMNKALFLKTAVDADYQSTNVRLDDRRFYSISRTTRVQEIEELGQRGEHRIPEGEGGGLIWKLYSIARFEQRDAGVYVELEAVALSRDIPVVLRFLVDPIVQRVSRNTLLTSLQQTKDAVHGSFITATKPASVPASVEQLRTVPASLSNKGSAFTRGH
jgi:hypothetical protein